MKIKSCKQCKYGEKYDAVGGTWVRCKKHKAAMRGNSLCIHYAKKVK